MGERLDKAKQGAEAAALIVAAADLHSRAEVIQNLRKVNADSVDFDDALLDLAYLDLADELEARADLGPLRLPPTEHG